MKSILKWLVIIGGALFVLVVAAGIIFVKSIDVKKYKPEIEKAVTEKTGRSFLLGDDLDLSVFPWVGVKLSDVRLGNPEGFGQKDMISVERFEVRLKVMPLLSKQIEVKTFVVDSPHIYLEKTKAGITNWQDLAQKKEVEKPAAPDEKKAAPKAIPIESLSVGTFSITNGRLVYVDQAANIKKEISDMTLKMANISMDNPIDIFMSANVDGKPVSLEGKAGPIGKEPGKGTLSLDFIFKALGELEVKLAGNIIEPVEKQAFDFSLEILPFSPRKLVKTLGQELPVKTKDLNVLNALSLKANIKGNPKAVSLSNGVMVLDDSKLVFSMSAKEFDRPNLAFDAQLDSMDLDRYLPEPPPKESHQKDTSSQAGADSKKAVETKTKKKTDYTPLRKLILDGKFSADKLKAHGATIENIVVKMDAKNGLISMDPVSANLYSGNMASKLKLNVQKDTPRTTLGVNAKNIQAGPLLKDAMQKELIEGTLNADIDMSMAGDTPDMVKKTLNGKGNLLFLDGAIVGIDLANAVRNVKANLGLAEKPVEKPRTDFAELKVPFTAKKGLVNTSGSSLASPLLRVLVKGDVNLVKELLDLRVDPKFVATLKGQGDTKQRSGLMVPVNITGPFSKPKVRPDLKGMISSGAVPGKEDLIKNLGSKEDQEKKLESVKKDVKKQIKGLIPGLMN